MERYSVTVSKYKFINIFHKLFIETIRPVVCLLSFGNTPWKFLNLINWNFVATAYDVSKTASIPEDHVHGCISHQMQLLNSISVSLRCIKALNFRINSMYASFSVMYFLGIACSFRFADSHSSSNHLLCRKSFVFITFLLWKSRLLAVFI